MRLALLTLFMVVVMGTASAKTKTEMIDYTHNGVALQGYLVYDDARSGKMPGVLVCHEWWGLNDYPKHRAEQLAELGYVAFCLDMYGKGVVAKTVDEAKAQVGKLYGDRQLVRSRALAGLDILKKQPNVDPGKIAVIGYCFGGMVALELARSGAEIAGVVSFHGALNTPNKDDAKNIKAKVLVLHGADDPNVKPEEVAAFEQEMRDAKVDWELMKFGGAVHAFTNPAAGNDPSKGAAYNEKADQRSWQAMKDFFAEIFK
jgi:dienelactone hydrolase